MAWRRRTVSREHFTQLRLLLARGQGVEVNPSAAALVWRVAAAKGEAAAAYNLGMMYAQGIGVAANRERARYWLSIAAPHNAGARAALQKVPR
ncbi:hypothetical protein [Dankookia sp. P2]|uniref:SEL1-like repeat protein n=1 Tax=Dankookia sp. P2 TaxID=3423955 RepID=UPI003D6772CB